MTKKQNTIKPFLLWVLLLCALLLSSCAAQAVRETGPESGTETLMRDTEEQTKDPESPTETEGAESKSPDTETERAETETGQESGDYRFERGVYSYEDLQSDLAKLESDFPDLFSYASAGISADGRELYVYTVGSPDSKRILLVTASMHGREYLTTPLVLQQTHRFLTLAKEGAQEYAGALSELSICVFPMVNPDGVTLSQKGLEGIRSETLRKKIQSIYASDYAAGVMNLPLERYLPYWKANANGVDLNRNCDALWEQYRGMQAPSMANFKGTEPASEPETRILTGWVKEKVGAGKEILLSLCMHAQGEVIYWNCGQSGESKELHLHLAQLIADTTKYAVDMEPENDASFSDWCVLEMGIPAVTVEVGKGSAPLPGEQLQVIASQNRDLWPALIRFFRAA